MLQVYDEKIIFNANLVTNIRNEITENCGLEAPHL